MKHGIGSQEANGGVAATCRLAITSRSSAVDGVLDTLPKGDDYKKGVLERAPEKGLSLVEIAARVSKRRTCQDIG